MSAAARHAVIADRRHVDGVVRSSENADLAAGYDRVLVVSVLDLPGGDEWGMDLAGHLGALWG